jgi:hypothetical protein
MIEKLKINEQAQIRSNLYKITLGALQEQGLETEEVSNGAIVHLANGQFARIKVMYCNPEKFSLEKERELYQEKLSKAAERKAHAAQVAKAKEKAERNAKKNEN